MKKEYKQLQKKLKNSFVQSQKDYGIVTGVHEWLLQSGLKPNLKHKNIVYTIFGSVPYPYQEVDRKTILKYLKKNKYKEFKQSLIKS